MSHLSADELPSLGLPPGYDHDTDFAYIPTLSDLQKAAINALDDKIAFVLGNHDDPQAIADHLDDIAEIVRAALAVRGDHQARALRLGLSLPFRYWLSRSKLDEWVDLIAHLIPAALDLGSRELLSEIYQTWGIYLYLARGRGEAKTALEKAIRNADLAGRDDLALMMRAELFNVEVTEMSLEMAHDRAEELLVQARRLAFSYINGRVYLSLARAYERAMLSQEMFAYAQQALPFFWREGAFGLAGEAMILMLGSLQLKAGYSVAHQASLQAYLEQFAQRSINPWFQAAVYYRQGVNYYHRQEFDHARACLLKAWLKYHSTGRVEHSLRAIVHMLGLIETKRHLWFIAEHHLKAAIKRYDQSGEVVLALHAQHALAFIPYEQEDFARALSLLQEVLGEIESLPVSPTLDPLVELLEQDIVKAENKIARPIRADR